MVDYPPRPIHGTAVLKRRLQQGRNALKRHPGLVWLLAAGLSLLISWAPWYLGGAGYFPLGLSLAGLIVVATVDGWQGVLGLLKRSSRARVPLRWYALAFLLPAALALAALGLQLAVSHQRPSVPIFQSRLWLSLLVYFVVAIINPLAGPVGQEVLGLRGYALPKLHAQVGALWASLLIGGFWGLWYLPEFFDPTSPQSALGWGFFLPFVLLEIAISTIVTWVYNRTGESVLVSAILMNIAFNFWWAALLSQAPSASRREFPPLDPQVFGWNIALTFGVALILLILTRGRLGEVEGARAPSATLTSPVPPKVIPPPDPNAPHAPQRRGDGVGLASDISQMTTSTLPQSTEVP